MRRNTDMRTSPQTLATVALGIAVGVLAAAAAFPDRPARVGSSLLCHYPFEFLAVGRR